MFKLTVDPQDAPSEPQLVTLTFEKGVPVALDGKALSPVAMVETLNRVAGAHGVGRLDLVENRLVGIKSRGYTRRPPNGAAHRPPRTGAPGARPRHAALQAVVSVRYAQLIYDGLWFSTLREALAAFVSSTRRT